MSIVIFLSNTKPKSEWPRKIGTSASMFVLRDFIQSGVVARKTFETRLLKTIILLSVKSSPPEGGSCAWAIYPCRHSICPSVVEIAMLSTLQDPRQERCARRSARGVMPPVCGTLFWFSHNPACVRAAMLYGEHPAYGWFSVSSRTTFSCRKNTYRSPTELRCHWRS